MGNRIRTGNKRAKRAHRRSVAADVIRRRQREKQPVVYATFGPSVSAADRVRFMRCLRDLEQDSTAVIVMDASADVQLHVVGVSCKPRRRLPGVFRIHGEMSQQKIEAMRDALRRAVRDGASRRKLKRVAARVRA